MRIRPKRGRLSVEKNWRFRPWPRAAVFLALDVSLLREAVFVIACRPEAPSRGVKHYIRVWSCDGELSSSDRYKGETSVAPRALKREGWITSMEDHVAPVSHLAVNSTCLLSCDAAGEARGSPTADLQGLGLPSHCAIAQATWITAQHSAAKLGLAPMASVWSDWHSN
eukprot:Skav233103  [mRNA]  locus=scaffold1342:141791:149076:- [translate_table: standard]